MNAHEFTFASLLLMNDPSVTASSVPSRIASFSHESLPVDVSWCCMSCFCLLVLVWGEAVDANFIIVCETISKKNDQTLNLIILSHDV
jgi:hypothetical protein